MSYQPKKATRDELIAGSMLEQISQRVAPYFEAHKQCVAMYDEESQPCQRALMNANVSVQVVKFQITMHCAKFYNKFLNIAKTDKIDSNKFIASHNDLWQCVDYRLKKFTQPVDIESVYLHHAQMNAAFTGKVEPEQLPPVH